MYSLIQEIFNFSNQKISPNMISDIQIKHLIKGMLDIDNNGVEGDIVELGCNVGESSKYLRKSLDHLIYSDKKLWVYDSFDGLPDLSKWEQGTPWKPGTLKTSKEVLVQNFEQNNLTPPDHIIKDWFKDISNEDLPDKISLAFLDGDFYESIYDSLLKIYDRVEEGGYIFFHDYKRPDLPGVAAAIDDFFSERNETHSTFSVCDQLGLLIKPKHSTSENKKLGFLHIPRTGGTHLERVLNPMGPEKLINFFGANEGQAINHIPIIEDMKPGDRKNQRLLNNINYKTCKLFAGHFSHNIEKCFKEEVDFFTILRDPIQRVISLSKQFLTSKYYKEIICKNSQTIGDNEFFNNLFNYLKEGSTTGLLVHESHGFSNYMTKVLSGSDISDPNLIVDDAVFKTAISNLKKLKYFGFFEDYENTIQDILSILGENFPYKCGSLKIADCPDNIKQLLLNLNQYDIKLYEEAKKIKAYRNFQPTYVTALLNIDRDKLDSNLFSRSFDQYLNHFKKLLTAFKNKNLVVYIEEEYFEFVRKIKPHNVILRAIDQDFIRNQEYYNKIQDIRKNPRWYYQSQWLSNSPQAKLELYNPLIFQKIHLLNEVSTQNPFNNNKFFWIDAGISNAQANPDSITASSFDRLLCKDIDKFLFINYPYNNFKEIHGFKKEGLERFYNGAINTVTRATFFGGKASYINFLTQEFSNLAHNSLDAGFLGTEESIFTLMNYLYPNYINARYINNSGLVRHYFNQILDPQSNPQNTLQSSNQSPPFTPTAYKNLRNQQHPLAFKTFTNFFETSKKFDLIIEIGSGFGGFSYFLHDQSIINKSKFITYEKNSQKHQKILTAIPDIDCRCQDVFNESTQEEIESLIATHSRVLILCDGDSVSKEFNTFCKIIKQNDVIMAHDYAPNKEIFDSKYKNKVWNWMEISDKDISKNVETFGLVDIYPEFLKVAWVAKQKTKPDIVPAVPHQRDIQTHLYILTFNFPDQLHYTIKSLESNQDWLTKPKLFLLDNSTNLEAKSKNQEIAKQYKFEYIDLGSNTGICGGRQAAAEHFDKSDADFMFFFEDDMTLNNQSDSTSLCRNGFNKFIPNLYSLCHKIMVSDKFDFLKLSFTEVYFDNDKQCSWYNVPQSLRTEIWPHYDQLPTTGLDPNVPLTEFKNIRSMDGVSYIDGQIYYANWPMIVSRSGNKKMFIETKWHHPYEQTWMSYIFKKTLKKEINPAILLASPITHNRFKHYQPGERREN